MTSRLGNVDSSDLAFEITTRETELLSSLRGRLIAAVVCLMLATSAWADRAEDVLYPFAGGADGANPSLSGLESDPSENLYGTTFGGGTNGFGTVFELTQNAAGGWTETVLYSFASGTDGARPSSGVILDSAGNLYGTTPYGGVNGLGIVFELSPTGNGWIETVLHSFSGGSDGNAPYSGLVFDRNGNLYGTTFAGGGLGAATFGSGTVFELTRSNGTWTEKVIYSFKGGTDAANPSNLILDGAGNLYGSGFIGGASAVNGASGEGAVFELSPSNGAWAETVIHSFDDSDGANPRAGLTIDRAANLYGTTSSQGLNGYGSVFRLTRTPAGTWTETVLFSFGTGPDGGAPSGDVILDNAGNLYGTTSVGGGVGCLPSNGCGTVFELTPTASGSWTEAVLYRFTGGNDGGGPEAGMILNRAGNLYGTANNGGTGNFGVVFEVIAPVGTISVATNLSAATFTVTGPATFSGTGTSATFTNVPVGMYTTTFGPVTGYVTPAAQTKTLPSNGTIAFTGTYKPVPPSLILSPTTLSFTYQVGTRGPIPSQSVSVTASSGAVTFTASASTIPAGGSWLSVLPSRGGTPATLNVSVAQHLGPRTYSGNITVTSPGAVNSPFIVPVNLTVTLPGAASSGRPILFVHGFCDDSRSWKALRDDLSTRLKQNFPTLYRDTNNYDVYYDGTSVRFPDVPLPSASARFFSINFYDRNGGGFDRDGVAQVSILNKADELANVTRAITTLTGTKDVIIVAHSMGGLVSRAYLEYLASKTPCYDYLFGSPDYVNGCSPGSTKYQGDVAELITIDTPHGGCDLLQRNNLLFGLVLGCNANPSTNSKEMIPGSQLLNTLNYFANTIAVAKVIRSGIGIQSIESYYQDPNGVLKDLGWLDCLSSDPSLGCREDTVLSFSSQSMELSLSPAHRNGARFTDWGNPYTVEAIGPQPACQLNLLNLGTIPVLHFLPCVGGQSNTKALVHLLVEPNAVGH
jgi:uncharacterized repeat protein (TIGR03803 family)